MQTILSLSLCLCLPSFLWSSLLKKKTLNLILLAYEFYSSYLGDKNPKITDLRWFGSLKFLDPYLFPKKVSITFKATLIIQYNIPWLFPRAANKSFVRSRTCQRAFRQTVSYGHKIYLTPEMREWWVHREIRRFWKNSERQKKCLFEELVRWLGG